jgi:hypothetical protein
MMRVWAMLARILLRASGLHLMLRFLPHAVILTLLTLPVAWAWTNFVTPSGWWISEWHVPPSSPCCHSVRRACIPDRRCLVHIVATHDRRLTLVPLSLAVLQSG